MMGTTTNGDLNNTTAARVLAEITTDPIYRHVSFAIPASEDDALVRQTYRSFLLDSAHSEQDWIARLELSTALKMVDSQILKSGGERLKVLVLHGSMRKRSYSRLRILFRLGCDTTFNTLPKVQELRGLSKWSDGHVWISPEQHGNLYSKTRSTGYLSTGSLRPTQGRKFGGSQSFNTVNSLRILGRWMRMFTIPNQSSIPMAYTQLTDEDASDGGSRLMPSGNRDRLVDCMEEFVKYTIIMRPHFDLFGDRYSEREEKRIKEEEAALLDLGNMVVSNGM
ncbi:flavoprotein-like protein [Phaeosphaeriaceae sp. PMI808]|nr:flavoprotein-like protein [Phaeosphaeriaceae sp. PMI808]